MQLLLLAAVTTILAGCAVPATMGDVLAQPVYQIIDTSFTPDQTRDCFMSVQLDPIQIIPEGKGWTLVGYKYAMSITAASTGSHVEVRLIHAMRDEHYRLLVKPCIEKLPKVKEATP